MNGRSSSSLRWHLRNAARGINSAIARKGESRVAEDIAKLQEIARKIRANREALEAGLPLPFPPNPQPRTT